MVTSTPRSLLREPRPEQPPARVWRDWLLLVAVGVSFVVELAARDDLTVGLLPVAFVLLLSAALLWRRTAPLAAATGTFGALALTSVVALTGTDLALPFTLAWVLVLPYALLRWGSGRDAAIGLAIMLVTGVLDVVAVYPGALEAGVGIAILLLPAALGAAVRYRSDARRQELEQVRAVERQQLARELHDTVAHHVSAIAVQAQAGRVVAATDPSAAVAALGAIEVAASRTLDEMRSVVGLLRANDDGDLGPRHGLDDLRRLSGTGGWPAVAVQLTGELDDLSPTLAATVYRLAQEAVTNAVRHAPDAHRIDILVTGEADRVCLTVADDGAQRTAATAAEGFGLTGMRERTALLGGTLEVGPGPRGGWQVHAVLPRRGAVR